LCSDIPAALSNAAVYYVATNGRAGGTGSESDPWNTIQTAINAVLIPHFWTSFCLQIKLF
jgi:hypothetical protein